MQVPQLPAWPLGPFLVAILHQQVSPVTGDGLLVKIKPLLRRAGRPCARTEFVDVQRDLRRKDHHIIGDRDNRLCYASRCELRTQIKEDLTQVRRCSGRVEAGPKGIEDLLAMEIAVALDGQ